jgi:membrane dipeptidase
VRQIDHKTISLPRDVIIDGHEDISMNVLPEGRDYLTSARAVRNAEAEAGFENPNGICMLGLEDWLSARVAVIVTTIQTVPRSEANPGELSYPTIEGAHQQALAHLDLYRRWEAICPHIVIVRSTEQFDSVIDSWSVDDDAPRSSRKIGLVLLMENADPIRDPGDVEFWAEQGVCMIGPAWHANRFSGDTQSGEPLTEMGRELLREMGRLNLTLDLTHMSEHACLEALVTYDGFVMASHSHSRRIVDRSRLLSDDVIRGIVERDGMIGVLPLNWALDPNWKRGGNKNTVTLDAVVEAIDAVCQIAGDARHVGIGSDFDGGQGAESVPAELDTVGDLPNLASSLRNRGYTQQEIAGIMAGNWARFIWRSTAR